MATQTDSKAEKGNTSEDGEGSSIDLSKMKLYVNTQLVDNGAIRSVENQNSGPRSTALRYVPTNGRRGKY